MIIVIIMRRIIRIRIKISGGPIKTAPFVISCCFKKKSTYSAK